jgi:hypothetical protein
MSSAGIGGSAADGGASICGLLFWDQQGGRGRRVFHAATLLRALRPPPALARFAPAASRSAQHQASKRFGGRPAAAELEEPDSRPIAPANQPRSPNARLSHRLSEFPTAALAAAAAASDAARRRAPVSEILEKHAPAAMRGFCAAHGVEPSLEMRALGTATKPRHQCVLHLPLPPELQEVFGYPKLIRSGERSMRKKDAILSAKQVAGFSFHFLLWQRAVDAGKGRHSVTWQLFSPARGEITRGAKEGRQRVC